MVTTRILGTSILCSADIYAPQKEKIKVLLNFFQKIAVSKGRAFGHLPQKAKHSSWTSSTLIVRRLCGWIFQSKFWIEKEGAFVREKPPRGQPMCTFQKNLPVGGFFGKCMSFVCQVSVKGAFLLQNPLFFTPIFGLKNSPAKAPWRYELNKFNSSFRLPQKAAKGVASGHHHLF